MDVIAEQVPQLLAVARAIVGDAATPSDADDARDDHVRDVAAVVTIHADGALLASAMSTGADLLDAVRRAARRAVADPRCARSRSADPDVSLWIPTAVVDDLDVGRDAVITTSGRVFRPSVALTRGYVEPDHALARLAPDGTRRIETWRHFVAGTPSGETETPPAVELRRLRPDPPPMTAEHVNRIVDRALDRLLASQRSDGAYRYTDHAFRRRAAQRPNLVRLAGTAYAVALAATRARDVGRRRQLATSAARAVHHLLAHAATVAGTDDGILIRDARRRTLPAGAAALTLLAMQYGDLRVEFAPWRRRLTSALLSLQQPDGRFRGSPDSARAQDEGAQQDYFPGETMLALAHEAAHGDGLSHAAVTRAFGAHVEYFRTRPRLASALWQADVWRRVWRIVGGRYGGDVARPYAEFVREIGDHVLRRRRRDADEFRGGFARRDARPGISSACYVEALTHAYEVSAGDPDARRRYGTAVRAGLRFVARLQVDPVLTPMLPRPATSVGGFTPTLQSFELRCDHDQHAITMFLAAAEHPRLLANE